MPTLTNAWIMATLYRLTMKARRSSAESVIRSSFWNSHTCHKAPGTGRHRCASLFMVRPFNFDPTKSHGEYTGKISIGSEKAALKCLSSEYATPSDALNDSRSTFKKIFTHTEWDSRTRLLQDETHMIGSSDTSEVRSKTYILHNETQNVSFLKVTPFMSSTLAAC